MFGFGVFWAQVFTRRAKEEMDLPLRLQVSFLPISVPFTVQLAPRVDVYSMNTIHRTRDPPIRLSKSTQVCLSKNLIFRVTSFNSQHKCVFGTFEAHLVTHTVNLRCRCGILWFSNLLSAEILVSPLKFDQFDPFSQMTRSLPNFCYLYWKDSENLSSVEAPTIKLRPIMKSRGKCFIHISALCWTAAKST